MTSAYFFPENYMWSLSAMAILNSGGSFGEMFPVICSLREAAKVGDTPAWYSAWLALARRTERLARHNEEKGRLMSAGEFYSRAALYYQLSERFQKRWDVLRLEAFQQSLTCFERFCAYRSPCIEVVSIPYEGTQLRGYFIPAEGVASPAPAVAFFDGLDSTTEVIAMRALELAQRGVSVLAVDGPGWGAALRLQRLHTRHDYEVVGRATVDYLVSRPDVDSSRLGVAAYSMGGYYAPRIAAFEKRLKACAVWGAHWDYQERMRERLAMSQVGAPLSAPQEHSAWVFGAENLAEAVERASGFKLEGVARQITCSFLVIHGQNDRQSPVANAYRLYEAVSSIDKEIHVFTPEEGGSEHCQWDNMVLAKHYVFDWLARKLGGAAA